MSRRLAGGGVVVGRFKPSSRRDAELILNLYRQPQGGRAHAGQKLMSVGFAHADALQVGSLEVAQVLRHASTDMQYAYLLASEKVCILRDDPKSGRMQNAYMAKDTNHLAAWRTFRHMTQAELAEKVDTTKAVISNLETGARGLSDKWLRRLAPALGTTPGMLLDHNPNDLPTNVLETWAAIPDEQRDQALKVLQSFMRTGTDG